MPTTLRTPTVAAGSLFVAPQNALAENLVFSRVASLVPPAAASPASLFLSAFAFGIDTASTVTSVRVSRCIVVEGDSAASITVGFSLDGETFLGESYTFNLTNRGAVLNLAESTIELAGESVTPADLNDAGFGVLIVAAESPANVAGLGVDGVEVEVVTLGSVHDSPVLTGSATDQDHILTWTASALATEYFVESCATEEGVYVLIWEGTDLNLTLDGVGIDVTTFYRVVATGPLDDGPSNVVSLTTGVVLGAPADLAVFQPKNGPFEMALGTLRLTWDAVVGAENYDIERRVDDGEWIRIQTALEAVTYTDRTAYRVGDYDYRVRGNTEFVAGSWCDAVTGTVTVANAPDIDRQLRIENAQIVRPKPL